MRSILLMTAETGCPSLADVAGDFTGMVLTALGEAVLRAKLLSEGAVPFAIWDARRCNKSKA